MSLEAPDSGLAGLHHVECPAQVAYAIYSLLELALVPSMLLSLALPREVVIVLTALHERDEQVCAVVVQV